MCGRITTVEWDELLAVLNCIETQTPFNAYPDWPATKQDYLDAFPRREVPLICSSPGRLPEPAKKLWGFEAWDDSDVVFNTRIETAGISNMWKESFQRRHCVIPVHAFYEPHSGEMVINEKGRSVKQLYRFTDSDLSLLLFGGIWRDDRFSIMTKPPDDFVKSIHPRMPVIFSESDAIDWLYFKMHDPQSVLSDEQNVSLNFTPVYKKNPIDQQSLF